MEIIKSGLVPSDPAAWPVGGQLVCSLCTCEFRVTSKDDFEVIPAVLSTLATKGVPAILKIDCPHCKQSIGKQLPDDSTIMCHSTITGNLSERISWREAFAGKITELLPF